ncbi:MAG: archease [Chloroflexota bacterium]
MRRFKFIEHTADIGLVAYGGDLAGAFANAASGLFAIICEPAALREVASREIEIREANPEDLLFEWLNRLIYLFDTEGLLFKRFNVVMTGEAALKATAYGERYDPARHHLKKEVKAATYHQLKVDRAKNQVRVIFDI